MQWNLDIHGRLPEASGGSDDNSSELIQRECQEFVNSLKEKYGDSITSASFTTASMGTDLLVQ